MSDLSILTDRVGSASQKVANLLCKQIQSSDSNSLLGSINNAGDLQ